MAESGAGGISSSQDEGLSHLEAFVALLTESRHLLAERQAIMDVHIDVGHEFPSVRINTAYSFGLDDQEFVVVFESDSPSDFLDLVMKLRETKSSEFTLRDTPIFTCIAMSPADALDALASTTGAVRPLESALAGAPS